MRKYKNLIFNGLLVLLVLLSLYIVFNAGHSLELSRGTSHSTLDRVQKTFDLSESFNLTHSLSILILQIIVIIVFSRAMAWVMSLIGQPTVIGEIIAGIMLGPSLLGLFFPETFSNLFPLHSLPNLELLSQIGLILFMFIIGLELDHGVFKKRAKAALFISNSSIVLPYILGVILAYFLFDRFAPMGVSFISFSLFMGIAMSITAFPVLARIVQERGITKTSLGTIAITSAAINDITAWGILAVIVAISNATAIAGALITIILSLAFIALMLFVIRPLLDKVAVRYTVQETVSKNIVAAVFGIMLISSFITEIIGIHALFGAFMAGAIMPDNVRFKNIMSNKMEDISLVLLLPLFFVYTGLRTQIQLLNDSSLWLPAVIIIIVAVAGKFLGSAIASRIVGQSWKNSLLIGALMNTRGLIELVALNIGYDIGILSPEIFTMLVIMALVTTFMTGPAMTFIGWVFNGRDKLTSNSGIYKVLISFGPAESGARLLSLVTDLYSREKSKLKVTALHLTPNTEVSGKNAIVFEKQAFENIKTVANERELEINTDYRTSSNVSQEISRTANRGKFDLLVVGSSRPLIGSDKTGGKARHFFDKAKCDVALIIDNGFKEIKRVLIICMDESSNYDLHQFVMLFNDGVEVSTECLNDDHQLELNDYSKFDLILTGLECFREQRNNHAPWTIGDTSIMILSRYQEEQ